MTSRRADVEAVLLVLALYALALIVTSPLDNYPVIDDWVYAISVKSIVETGRFALPMPASANFIAQAYWGALFCLPFGVSFTALRVSTFVMGGIGVVAFYLLFRELRAERRVAIAGALTLAVNPFYLQLSASFMTDVPFTAMSAVSLWLYVRGANRDRLATLVGGYVCALVCIMIRQFGIALLVGFAAAHLVRKGFGLRAWTVAIGPILLGLALHVSYERWLVATNRIPVVPAPLGGLLPADVANYFWRVKYYAVASLPYIGLFTAPFVICVALVRRMQWPRRGFWLWSLAAGAVVALMIAAKHASFPVEGTVVPSFGNSLERFGLGPLISNKDRIAPVHAGWAEASRAATVLSAWVVGMIATPLAVVAARFVRVLGRPAERRQYWPHVLMVALIGTYMAGMLMLGGTIPIYDRYLLFLVVPACSLALLLSAPRTASDHARLRLLPFGLVTAALAAFSITASHDFNAWRRVKWQATDLLAREGVPPSKIDGGYEYNGWMLYDPNRPWRSDEFYRVIEDEYATTFGPLAGYEEVTRLPIDTWLWPHTAFVRILRRVPPMP